MTNLRKKLRYWWGCIQRDEPLWDWTLGRWEISAGFTKGFGICAAWFGGRVHRDRRPVRDRWCA